MPQRGKLSCSSRNPQGIKLSQPNLQLTNQSWALRYQLTITRCMRSISPPSVLQKVAWSHSPWQLLERSLQYVGCSSIAASGNIWGMQGSEAARYSADLPSLTLARNRAWRRHEEEINAVEKGATYGTNTPQSIINNLTSIALCRSASAE